MNMHQHNQENWLYERGPHLPLFEQIPHYYGDMVRILFLVAAVIVVAGAPLYADALAQQMPYIIVGAVALVACAALTSPRGIWVMRLNAVLAGVIAVVYETWALWGYESGSSINFVMREIPALIAVFAFYFSLKTLRAMLTGTIGRPADLNDFVPKRHRWTGRGPKPTVTEYAEDGLGHPAALEDDVGGMD